MPYSTARVLTQSPSHKVTLPSFPRQSEISQIARKTGISSAMRLAMVAPRPATWQPSVAGGPPEIEWWDQVVLQADTYDVPEEKTAEERYQGITSLVEHPAQVAPPSQYSRTEGA